MLVTSEHTAIPIVRTEDAENEKETEVSIEDHPTHKVKVTRLYYYRLLSPEVSILKCGRRDYLIHSKFNFFKMMVTSAASNL